MVAEGPDRTAVTGFFDADAPNWDSVYMRADVIGAIYQRRREICLRWLADVARPGRALDVGCGTGQTAIRLDRLGHHVTGTDTAPAMLALAAANATAAGAVQRIELRQADVHALPFPDGAFDVVVALGLIMWLEDPKTALAEMARVLAPGGWLVVSCDNRHRLNVLLDPRYSPALQGLRGMLRRQRSGIPPAAPEAVRHSGVEFEALVRSAGLTIQRRSSFGFGPFTFGGRELLPQRAGLWINGLLQGLADAGVPPFAGTGSQYILLARRG